MFLLAQAAVAEEEILAGRLESARARLEPLMGQGDAQDILANPLRPILAWFQLELSALAEAAALLQQTMREAKAQQMRPSALRVPAQAALEEALALCRAMPAPYSEAKLL